MENASWTEEHRPVLFVVMIVTVIMFILGAAHVVASIRAPFAAPTGLYKGLSQQESEEVAAQKTRDTDHDGLSDYDELNIYLTSPYLADTDSDGVDDGTEVKNGDNPNCPRGKTCGPSDSLVGPGVNPSDLTNTPTEAAAPSIPSAASTFVGLTPDLVQNMTPDQLRQLMLGAGVSQEVLAKFSDEQLMTLYQQTLAGNNPLGSASSTP